MVAMRVSNATTLVTVLSLQMCAAFPEHQHQDRLPGPRRCRHHPPATPEPPEASQADATPPHQHSRTPTVACEDVTLTRPESLPLPHRHHQVM